MNYKKRFCRYINNKWQASLAEYERELIREKTNAGLQSARAKGRIGGRAKTYTAEQFQNYYFFAVIKDVAKRQKEIYKPFGLTKATFYRYAKI